METQVYDEAIRRIDAFAHRTGLTREQARTVLAAREWLRQALGCLDRGENDRATGRIADALGLLADVLPDAPGIARFTGRGFRLERWAKDGAR